PQACSWLESVGSGQHPHQRALKFGGKPLRLLRLAVEGKLEIAISQPILDEIFRVLREKFGDSPAWLSEVEAWMREFTHLATPRQTLNIIKEDPDDNRKSVRVGVRYSRSLQAQDSR